MKNTLAEYGVENFEDLSKLKASELDEMCENYSLTKECREKFNIELLSLLYNYTFLTEDKSSKYIKEICDYRGYKLYWYAQYNDYGYFCTVGPISKLEVLNIVKNENQGDNYFFELDDSLYYKNVLLWGDGDELLDLIDEDIKKGEKYFKEEIENHLSGKQFKYMD